jgi:hypothetical protein
MRTALSCTRAEDAVGADAVAACEGARLMPGIETLATYLMKQLMYGSNANFFTFRQQKPLQILILLSTTSIRHSCDVTPV